jgi:ankyrin repeat protein
LSLNKLQHTLKIEEDELKLNIPSLRMIHNSCAGLIQFDSQNLAVQLIHSTVRDYFIREKTAWFPEAEMQLARKCLNYLSLDQFSAGSTLDDNTFEDRIRQYPFFSYASQHWANHMPSSSDEWDWKTVLKLLKDEKRLASMVQAIYARPGTGLTYSQHFPLSTTILQLAVILNSDILVQRLITNELDIEAANSFGETALYIAAREGRVDILKLLIGKGASITHNKAKNPSALIVAAAKGHEAATRLLLGHGANVRAVDHYERTALLRAVESGNATTVRFILEKKPDINAKDRNGTTALIRAVGRGDKNIARILVEHRADLDILDGDGRTALVWAIRASHRHIIKLLLQKGATKNRDRVQEARIAAASIGDDETLRILLKIPEKNKDTLLQNILVEASKAGHSSILHLALDSGARVNAPDVSNRFALYEASAAGHFACVQLLIDAGGDIQAKSLYGNTALLIAARYGNTEVVSHLIKKGARLEDVGQHRRTALLEAANNGRVATVKLLLESGANIEAKGLHSQTPLVEAVGRKHYEVAEILINHKANLEARGKYRRSTLGWAAENGDEPLVNYCSNEALLSTLRIAVEGARHYYERPKQAT